MRLFGRRRRDADLVDEIETHLSLLEQEHRRQGMSAEDARHAAHRAFGGVLKTRQVAGEQGRWQWLAGIVHDARVAARSLASNRGFAWAPVLVLGLGIGANSMIFTLGYSHTLRGLPIVDADRVLMASFVEGGSERQLSWADFEELRPQATLLSDIAAFGATIPVSVGDRGRAPDRYQATYLTANAFDIVAVRPLAGRTFTPAEERPGGASVALLGAGLWQARYASDAALIGREILVNGRATTVVGIVPDRAGLPSTAQVWLPVTHAAGFAPTDRAVRTLRAFGRVRNDVQVADARAQLETVLARAAAQAPSGGRLQPSVTTINERFFGTPTAGVWLAFFSAGFLVLVVSSANVANMMLARGVQRAREVAIRGSLGASRARVFSQLIIESIVMAAAGAVIGLALSRVGVRAFHAQIPADVLPYWLHYSMDATVLGLLTAVAFGTVLVFGLIPALQASRVDVIRVLRDGGWGGTGRTSSRFWTTALMAVQIGLACVLLAYGVTNSFGGEDPPPSDKAIRTPEILTASVSLAGDRYRTAEQRAEFFRTIRERVSASPGVSSVATTGILPQTGAQEQRLQLITGGTPSPEQLPAVATLSIGPGYFSTLGVNVLKGREFDDRDQAVDPAAVVNQRFVSTFSADADPIGRQVTIVNPSSKATRTVRIVGVAEDIRHRTAIEPVVYLPMAVTTPTTAFLLARHQLDPATMTAQLRDLVLGIDPNLPVFSAQTLERAVYDAGWNVRVSVRLVNTLTLIALVLAGVGLSATAAQAVYHRTKEIGIRVAVGARPVEIGRLVLRRAAVQVVAGLVLGAICTFGWDAAFFSGSSNARFTTPGVLLSIAAVIGAIMATACIVPVHRAVQLDPVIALRQD